MTSCKSKELQDNSGETSVTADGEKADADKHSVRFLTEDGTVIAIQEYEKGEPLVPPTPPQKNGHVFIGWDGDCGDITRNSDMIAQYMDISKEVNVITADTVYTAPAAQFEVTLGICGGVTFCGLDMDILYDSNLLEYMGAVDIDGCVTLNDGTNGAIYANYVTTNNTTGEVDFVTLKFKVKATEKAETSLQIKVNSMYALDQSDMFVKPEYQVLQNQIVIGGTE